MNAAGFDLQAFAGCNEPGGGCAVEAGVDVAGAGNFKAGEASEGAEGGDDFLGNDLGGFAESAGELQGEGRGELAEFEVGGNLDGDVLGSRSYFDLRTLRRCSAKLFCRSRYTWGGPQKSLIFKAILALAVRAGAASPPLG